jgi:predicted metal-dependent phosphoesterase TrpH
MLSPDSTASTAPVSFRLDTHVHTSEVSGCAHVPALDVVRLYKQAGYDGIVITDHYNSWSFEGYGVKSWPRVMDRYLSGYRAALEEGDRVGLVVLPGLEVTFDAPFYADFLVFGLDPEYLYHYPELHKLGLRRFRELVAPLGAYIVNAHPFRGGCTPGDPALLDGVEVFNGGNDPEENGAALAFARKHGLAELSGSDFHHRVSLGRGGVVLPERVTDAAGFVRVLRANPRPERIEKR